MLQSIGEFLHGACCNACTWIDDLWRKDVQVNSSHKKEKLTFPITNNSSIPQWQKSDDMTNKFWGSARYLLKSFPYSFSESWSMLPTRIGTIVNPPFLLQTVTFTIRNFCKNSHAGYSTKICYWYLSITFAINGNCISILCSSSSVSKVIDWNLPVAWSSLQTVMQTTDVDQIFQLQQTKKWHILAWSIGRLYNGVLYVFADESAQQLR